MASTPEEIERTLKNTSVWANIEATHEKIFPIPAFLRGQVDWTLIDPAFQADILSHFCDKPKIQVWVTAYEMVLNKLKDVVTELLENDLSDEITDYAKKIA
jgi:hypothetical protein